MQIYLFLVFPSVPGIYPFISHFVRKSKWFSYILDFWIFSQIDSRPYECLLLFRSLYAQSTNLITIICFYYGVLCSISSGMNAKILLRQLQKRTNSLNNFMNRLSNMIMSLNLSILMCVHALVVSDDYQLQCWPSFCCNWRNR